MTETHEEDWQQQLATVVGRRVKSLRDDAGLSAQQVATRCTVELGFKMLRTTLANLEAGTRKNITVGEIIALAEVLGVPPLTLLFPLDSPAEVNYLPHAKVSPHKAWREFTGGLPLPATVDAPSLPSQALETTAVAFRYSRVWGGQEPWQFLRAMADRVDMPDTVRRQADKDSERLVADAVGPYSELLGAGYQLEGADPAWLAALEALRRDDSRTS